ncbi:MAG: glutamate-1-semialdehyde 2,1-aminomutase, partial [candidate division Zixibacteria bacterium]|nr:glutamate-1-semialdehyde 2,1-aminomutase [candidate division Zixibacteria bacterium]
LFNSAKNLIPGGVNSPVRAYGSVGGVPPFIASGKGAEITDVDGNRYKDYVLSWGPLILGHAHPEVIKAIKDTAKNGTSYGAPTELEIRLAEAIVNRVKSVEQVRLVNSGTEATMTAVRLARGFTNRPIVLKFDGCYHGHSDGFLTKAGSGLMTAGIPSSPGVPEEITKLTISVPYNDLEAVKEVFKKDGDSIACIIVEPIAANMGVVPPVDGFLEGLRRICDKYEALLIFDEVITGFRVARGGAQELYDIYPDITCFGKIIGGGLPVGAIGGKAHIMDRLAPVGDIYQAGTLSGNPLAVTAGLKTLELLDGNEIYSKLGKAGQMLEDGMNSNLKESGITGIVQRVGSLMTLFFMGKPVLNFEDAKTNNAKLYTKYFHKMLDNGIYLAPSPYEAMFISVYHDEDIISKTAEIQKSVLENL